MLTSIDEESLHTTWQYLVVINYLHLWKAMPELFL